MNYQLDLVLSGQTAGGSSHLMTTAPPAPLPKVSGSQQQMGTTPPLPATAVTPPSQCLLHCNWKHSLDLSSLYAEYISCDLLKASRQMLSTFNYIGVSSTAKSILNGIHSYLYLFPKNYLKYYITIGNRNKQRVFCLNSSLVSERRTSTLQGHLCPPLTAIYSTNVTVGPI